MNLAVRSRRAHPEMEIVRAVPCGVPGLAINADVIDPRTLIITHVLSGYAVAYFPGVDGEAVLAAASELAKLTDWTQEGADIADEVARYEVVDIASRWGGHCDGPPPIKEIG